MLCSRVEARECPLVVLVDIDELAEELVVDFPVVGIWVVGLGDLDALRDVIKCDVSQSGGGVEGGAASVGQAWVLDLTNRPVQEGWIFLRLHCSNLLLYGKKKCFAIPLPKYFSTHS